MVRSGLGWNRKEERGRKEKKLIDSYSSMREKERGRRERDR